MSGDEQGPGGKPPAGEPACGAGESTPGRPAGGGAPPGKPAAEAGPPAPHGALDALTGAMPEAIEEVTRFLGEVTVRVKLGRLLDVCRFLRDDPRAAMNLLSDLCAADYPKDAARFEVNYHLYSIPRNQRIRVKVRVDDKTPVATVSEIWPTANWHEREAFDLFGISFDGHPDLTRILLPDDWKGHPLRKEYPLEGFAEQHPRFR